MTKIKGTSTFQFNKQNVFKLCPITYVMEKIGGYWKPIILFHLLSGSKRYSELRKAIPAITEKMLIQHLKQLENDSIVIRESKPVVPPYVTYTLSESGMRLQNVLYAMAVWGIEERKDDPSVPHKDMKDFPGNK